MFKRSSMKKIRILLIVLLVMILLIMSVLVIYRYQLSPVAKSDKVIKVEIPAGSTVKEILGILKDKKLIRNKSFAYYYIKLTGKDNFKASTYELKQNMSTEEILEIMIQGNNYNPNQVTITFKEGINMREIAKIIASKTNNTSEEVIAKSNDETYLNTLINKYWFITNDIKKKDIYYKLEGYLYPDTYVFANKDVTVEEIFNKMIEEMNTNLKSLKADFIKSSFSAHQILTMSSIVELEGVSDTDRDKIAGVFYNRLKAKDRLGSDVTACYAFKIDVKNCNDNVPYTTYNPYNTRAIEMAGKLPVGPICSPSINSIKGTLYYKEHNYYYFVADKNKKVYFMKTYTEFQQVIKEIKDRGEWPW